MDTPTQWWWRYLTLPDYNIRERIGYTLAEVAWWASDVLHPLSDRVSAWGSRFANWAAGS